MCYTRRKLEGGVAALRVSDDTNFLKPNGQSRNLNIYGVNIALFSIHFVIRLMGTMGNFGCAKSI